VQLGEPAHQGEADAEAASAAVERRVALDEELEYASAQLLDIPLRCRSTPRTASLPAWPTRTRTVPPAGVNLSAFPTRFATICSIRVSSASTQTDPGCAPGDEGETAGGLEHCERTRHHGSQVDRAALEHDLAHDRAPGVEQIVGEAREMLDLPRDDARACRDASASIRGWSRRWLALAIAPSGLRSSWPQHRQELVLGAARRLGRGSGFALAPQKLLALGFVLRPLGGRRRERAAHLADLQDRRRRRHHGLAPAERLRGSAQPGHRAHDAAGDDERRNHPERDREENPAAVTEQRARRAGLDRGGRDADRDRPPVSRERLNEV
jgi:hypothetical protein